MNHSHLSQGAVDDLLSKLSTDDGFRAAFLADPAAFGVAADALPANRQLPSKETLRATREALRAKFAGSAGLSWFINR